MVEEILGTTDWDIYSLERITARPSQLGALAFSPRIHRIYHDFRAEFPERILRILSGVDYIIHCGAEVHGLRSLLNPELFVQTNVMGTFNLLEAARVIKPQAFLYLSSAEAVGSVGRPHSLTENAPLRPSNPYSAAKGVGELLCRSYSLSFKVPTIVVRTMNIFGERQDVSKFVPMVTKKILRGEEVICHMDADKHSGSRHWIYVEELVQGMLSLLQKGIAGQTYHIVGPEMSNLTIIRVIELALDKPCNLQFQQPGRSHDMRYSIVDTKLKNYNASLSDTQAALIKTVLWYKENQEWLQ